MRALRAVAWALWTATLLAAGLAALIWQGSERILRPALYHYPGAGDWQGETPESEYGIAYRDVEFPAAGGSHLRGWLAPGRPGAHVGVVCVHGASSDRRALLRHLPFLHAEGYPVLLFDLRDYGRSDGAGRGLGLGFRELHDVSSAVAWLRRDDRAIRRVAVFGIGQGAVAAVLAAAGDLGIDAVIAESPWTRLSDLLAAPAHATPLLPEPLARAIRDLAVARVGATGEPEPIDVIGSIAIRPVMLMHGTADAVVPVEHTEALFERAGEPKELLIVEGGEHAALDRPDPDAYRERVLTFLRRWLGPLERRPR